MTHPATLPLLLTTQKGQSSDGCPAHIVTRVEIPGISPLAFTPPKADWITPGLPPDQRRVVFPWKMTRRIARFVQYCFVQGNLPDWDCHSFVGYATSYHDRFTYMDEPYSYPGDIDPMDTQLGIPYLIISDENPAHSIIGYHLRGASLSVLGIRSPLVLCKNDDLMQHYNGTRLERLFNQ